MMRKYTFSPPENVTFADVAPAQRCEVPRRHIVDMHQIEAGVDKPGYAPARRLDDDAPRWESA
jgi:hypothetical protein